MKIFKLFLKCYCIRLCWVVLSEQVHEQVHFLNAINKDGVMTILKPQEDLVPVARICDFDDEDMISIELDEEEILICRVEGNYYALSNICSHAHVELVDGELDGCFVTCPLHFSQFDVRTGEPQGPPAKDPVATYEVRVVDDVIYINPE